MAYTDGLHDSHGGRFKELDRGDFSSHAPMLDRYRAMLMEWEKARTKTVSRRKTSSINTAPADDLDRVDPPLGATMEFNESDGGGCEGVYQPSLPQRLKLAELLKLSSVR